MHHRKTYMYINFQQNRASRSVKTVHIVYLQKFANCKNLQLAIRISKNHAFRTYTTPLRTFMLKNYWQLQIYATYDFLQIHL